MLHLFSNELEEKAKKHALEKFPQEMVCVFTEKDCIFLENIAADRENAFLVDEKALLEIGLENVKCIVHSHPTNFEPMQYPSALDMKSQMNFGVPFGIVACSKERAYDIEYFGDGIPKKKEELCGRYFIHGIQDCYSLIRDYYLLELGIKLPDFPRDWNWWENGGNLYEDFFGDAGFYSVPLSSLRRYDLFFMSLGISAVKQNKVNHGGIYLGDDIIFHHKSGAKPYDTGQVSCKENIYRYSKYFRYAVRHKDLA